MEKYDIRFSVEVSFGESYSRKQAVNFSVVEQLPTNVDAQKFIRQRLAEEVSRNFAKLDAPLDNFTDEAKAAVDPLEVA